MLSDVPGQIAKNLGREAQGAHEDEVRARQGGLPGVAEPVPVSGTEVAVTGCGKLYSARSRLYGNEILEVNMRLKALAEIYKMHSFAPFAKLNLGLSLQ